MNEHSDSRSPSPQRVTPTNTNMLTVSTSFASSANTTIPSSPSSSARDSSCVQVAVRIRPVLSWEKKECVCQVVQDDSIQIGGSSGPRFTFDRVFDPTTTQAQLFQHAVEPLIQKCLTGFNTTIFAYGQTGSGKTFS